MTYKEAEHLKVGQKIRIKHAKPGSHKIKGIHILPKTVEVLLDDGKWYMHKQLGLMPMIMNLDFQNFINNIFNPVELSDNLETMAGRKTTVESTLQAALQFADRLTTTSSGTLIYPDYSFLDKQKPAGDTIFIALYTDFFIMHIIALLDKLKHKVIDGYIPDEIVFNVHTMLVDSPYTYAEQLLQNEICNKTKFFVNVDGVNALAYSCIPNSGESYVNNLKSISKLYLFREDKIFVITDASYNLIYMYVEDRLSIVTNHLFLIDPTNIHPVIFIDDKKQFLDWFMLSAIKRCDDDFIQSMVTMKKLEQNSQNLFSI